MDSPALWHSENPVLSSVPVGTSTAASVASAIVFEKIFVVIDGKAKEDESYTRKGIHIRIKTANESLRGKEADREWITKILTAIHVMDDQRVQDTRITQFFSTYSLMPAEFKNRLREQNIKGKGQLIEYALEQRDDCNRTFSYYVAELSHKWQDHYGCDRMKISLSSLFSVAFSMFISSSLGHTLTRDRMFEYIFSMVGMVHIPEYISIYNRISLETVAVNRFGVKDIELECPIPAIENSSFTHSVVPRNESSLIRLTHPGKYGYRYITYARSISLETWHEQSWAVNFPRRWKSLSFSLSLSDIVDAPSLSVRYRGWTHVD